MWVDVLRIRTSVSHGPSTQAPAKTERSTVEKRPQLRNVVASHLVGKRRGAPNAPSCGCRVEHRRAVPVGSTPSMGCVVRKRGPSRHGVRRGSQPKLCFAIAAARRKVGGVAQAAIFVPHEPPYALPRHSQARCAGLAALPCVPRAAPAPSEPVRLVPWQWENLTAIILPEAHGRLWRGVCRPP